MARNPFVTVPGGPEWAQRAWYAQYLRNMAIQDDEPDWRNILALSVGKGLNQGVEGFFDGRQEGRRVDNTFSLKIYDENQQNARNQALVDQSRQNAEAKAAAERAEMMRTAFARKYLYGATQPTMQPTPDAMSHATFGDEAQFPSGGVNPFEPATPTPNTFGGEAMAPRGSWFDPVAPEPMGGATSQLDTLPPPPAMGGATAYAPQPPTRVPGQSSMAALAGMPLGLIGALPSDEIGKFLERDKSTKTMTPGEYEQHIKNADMLDLRDPAAAVEYRAQYGLPANLPRKPQTTQEKSDEAKAGITLRAYQGDIPGVRPEVAAGVAKEPGEPRSQLASLSTAGVLQTLIAAPDGSPVFNDPLAKSYGATPDEIRASARRTLYGDQAPQKGGIYGYEAGIAGARGYAAAMGVNEAKLDMPLKSESQRWINPQTLEAAPSDMTARQALDAKYVNIDDKQFQTLDGLRQAGPLVAEIQAAKDPAVIGPIMGRVQRYAEMANLAPQAYADLRAATMKYLAAVGRVEAGAALTPTEKSIYFGNHPQVTMSPQEFDAALAMTETGLRIARSRVLGTTPPKPGESQLPIGQEVTLEGRRVVVESVNQDGSVNVHDPLTKEKNVWRPK